jgi:hypothetical protein
MVALGLSFPGIIEQIKECDYCTKEKEGEEPLHFETNGRHIYDGKLFEEFDAREISEKLGCTVEVYYEGEDKEDAERLECVDGKITKHRQLRWVDVLEENWMVDDEVRKRIRAMAHGVFDNDGIEEFVPEMMDFAEVIYPDVDTKELKAATHAAFVAMLGGFKVDEAVELVLKNRDDIMDQAYWGEKEAQRAVLED